MGNLEKMYIPPLVDPALGLEDNQILIENRMALGAASQGWNASFINKVGDDLPSQYKKRYVINLETDEKSMTGFALQSVRTRRAKDFGILISLLQKVIQFV
jgi:hypothetical protein